MSIEDQTVQPHLFIATLFEDCKSGEDRNLYSSQPPVSYSSLRVVCSCSLNVFVMTTVGYKMDTLYYSFLSSALEVDSDVVADMPGWSYEDSDLRDCSQNYTTGMATVFYSFLLASLSFKRLAN